MIKNLSAKQIMPKHRVGDYVKLSCEIIAASSLKNLVRLPKGMEFKVIEVKVTDHVVGGALPYYKDSVRSCFDYEVESIGETNMRYEDGTFGITGNFYFSVNGDFLRVVEVESREKAKIKKDAKMSYLDHPLSKEQKFPKSELPQLKKNEKQAKPKKNKKSKKKAAADLQTH